LLGEPFGEVAAYRRLRGFAAKQEITVVASRLRATVDRRPRSRVDHQSSRADIPWPLRPIAERRRARRNGSAAKSVRVTAQGMPTNGRRQGPALFEREITASGASASSRSAGDGRRPFDRRDETIFAGELFRRGSRIGGTAGGRK
jgi:hypothetical protein